MLLPFTSIHSPKEASSPCPCFSYISNHATCVRRSFLTLINSHGPAPAKSTSAKYKLNTSQAFSLSWLLHTNSGKWWPKCCRFYSAASERADGGRAQIALPRKTREHLHRVAVETVSPSCAVTPEPLLPGLEPGLKKSSRSKQKAHPSHYGHLSDLTMRWENPINARAGGQSDYLISTLGKGRKCISAPASRLGEKRQEWLRASRQPPPPPKRIPATFYGLLFLPQCSTWPNACARSWLRHLHISQTCLVPCRATVPSVCFARISSLISFFESQTTNARNVNQLCEFKPQNSTVTVFSSSLNPWPASCSGQ